VTASVVTHPDMPLPPSDEYEERLKSRASRVAHYYEKLHIRIGNARFLLAGHRQKARTRAQLCLVTSCAGRCPIELTSLS